jgi:hypothetical protein
VVVDSVASEETLVTVRDEHERAAATPGVWGVPTFLTSDDRAVFVRLMDRNHATTGDERAHGRATVERVLDLLEWTDLNEFKATRIPR